MMGFDTERILSDVPRMRRYAALMCGNDKVLGDQVVELALKDLVIKPDLLVGQDDYRPRLFRMLQARLAEQAERRREESGGVLAAEGGESCEDALADDALAYLAEMPVEQRSALLLVVIEQLSYEHVGYVLGTTAAIVKALLVDAKSRLPAESPTTSKTA